jgi:hypothetical protein
MRKILAVLLVSSASAFASVYDSFLDGPSLLDGPPLLEAPAITTIYDNDGFTVFYPAGKANEWSVSRTSYGHTRATLEEIATPSRLSRDTTHALLNGGSILDAAFPD